MTMDGISDYKVILMLGSYDDTTKKIIYRTKEHIIQNFSYIDTSFFVFLLDNLDIYVADVIDDQNETKKIALILEKYYDNKLTVFTIYADLIIDIVDITIVNDMDSTLNNFLKEKYVESTFYRLTILEQLKELTRLTSLTFLIRDQELTRGGEYIEMVYLLSRSLKPENIYFMKKEGFQLSAMAMEIIDYSKVQFRCYIREIDLHREITRIIQNQER